MNFRSSKSIVNSKPPPTNQPRTSQNLTSIRNSTATPQQFRTPARTPGDRKTFNPGTAEKEKAPGPEEIQEKSVRILNELAEIGGYNELVQKGFAKALTVRMFITILQHFLKPIVGKIDDDFASNYVESVHQIITQLEYPYSFTKSSLKTPNAQFCLNNTILLLSWLQDFSRDQDLMQYTLTEELDNDELATHINEKIGEKFKIWNNGEIDLKEANDSIAEAYRGAFEGADNIEADCEELREEIKQLTSKSEEMKRLENEINCNVKIVQELTSQTERASKELDRKKKAEKEARDELKHLQSKVSNQKMSTDFRHQLLLEINQIKSAISSKCQVILELREECGEKELLVSNLISKQHQLIDQLNNMIYKLSSDLTIAGIAGNFDPSEYTINSTDDLDQSLHHMYGALTGMKKGHIRVTAQIREKGLALETEFQKLSTENDILEAKVNQLQEMVVQLTQNEQSLESRYKSYINNTLAEHQANVAKIEEMEREIEERTKGIEQMKQQLEELTQKQNNLDVKAIEICERLYEERKAEIDSRRNFLTENLARIDNYHKNKQPLDESLQKILELVVKKGEDKENPGISSKS